MLNTLILLGLMSSAEPNTHVLLVSINDYPDSQKISDLEGPFNDAQDLSEVLVSKYIGKNSKIKILSKPSETKKDQIVFHIQQLEKAHPGDTVIFGFFGHGTQIAGDAPNYLRQAIMPSDVHRIPDANIPVSMQKFEPKSLLSGEEIGTMFDRVAQAIQKNGVANLTLIFDCCHSGGVSRGTLRCRGIDSNIPILPSHDQTPNLLTNPNPAQRKTTSGTIVLSAARSDQKAWESGGRGYFTSALVNSLNNPGVLLNYKSLFASVQQQMLSKAKTSVQEPVIAGDQKDLSRQIFNANSLNAPEPIRVTYLPPFPLPTQASKQQKREHSLRLSINRGDASGLGPGDIFELRHPQIAQPLYATVVPEFLLAMSCRIELLPESKVQVGADLKKLHGAKAVLDSMGMKEQFLFFAPHVPAETKTWINSQSRLVGFIEDPQRAAFAIEKTGATNSTWQFFDAELNSPSASIPGIDNPEEGHLPSKETLLKWMICEAQKKIIQRIRPSHNASFRLSMEFIPHTSSANDDGTALLNALTVSSRTKFAIKVKATGATEVRAGLALMVTIPASIKSELGEPTTYPAILAWPQDNRRASKLVANGSEWFLGHDGTLVPVKDGIDQAVLFQLPAQAFGYGTACFKLIAIDKQEYVGSEFFELLSPASRGSGDPKPSTLVGKMVSLKELEEKNSKPKSAKNTSQWAVATKFIKMSD
jgi:hypothetical protein